MGRVPSQHVAIAQVSLHRFHRSGTERSPCWNVGWRSSVSPLHTLKEAVCLRFPAQHVLSWLREEQEICETWRSSCLQLRPLQEYWLWRKRFMGWNRSIFSKCTYQLVLQKPISARFNTNPLLFRVALHWFWQHTPRLKLPWILNEWKKLLEVIWKCCCSRREILIAACGLGGISWAKRNRQ